MEANQQVEAISIAVGNMFGGKKGGNNEAPKSAEQLEAGLSALFSGR